MKIEISDELSKSLSIPKDQLDKELEEINKQLNQDKKNYQDDESKVGINIKL